MARFRSLRWRLTAFYLGLLAVLLLVGGFAQNFAAREVLFRTNAQVLTSEYAAVLTAFRKQNVNRPAAALRPHSLESIQSPAGLPAHIGCHLRPQRGPGGPGARRPELDRRRPHPNHP